MADKKERVYFGDDFAYSEQMDFEVIQYLLGEGSVDQAQMPTPTRRNPFKTSTVYRWNGVRVQSVRDLSAQMPPFVTELAAQGSRPHRTMASSWRHRGLR
jgi:hypothetical protein